MVLGRYWYISLTLVLLGLYWYISLTLALPGLYRYIINPCATFISKDTTNIPKLPGPPNTEMTKLEITVQGVTKLHKGSNGGKASVPDELPNFILKKAFNEISPFLQIIFDVSLDTLNTRWLMLPPSSKKGISTLRQTIGRYPSHVFVPN